MLHGELPQGFVWQGATTLHLSTWFTKPEVMTKPLGERIQPGRREHAIGHLKNWKMLAKGYRGRLADLPGIIRVITKLELYRLGW